MHTESFAICTFFIVLVVEKGCYVGCVFFSSRESDARNSHFDVEAPAFRSPNTGEKVREIHGERGVRLLFLCPLLFLDDCV